MGTPRRKAWPVGQVVKTAASHAVNIGSNPVRVTIPKKRCFSGTLEDKKSSGEMNSPCGKVLLRKTLERATRHDLTIG